jgi:hypothetical protein
MNSKTNIYSTSDLTLAAVISLYYPIFSIDKSNPNKVVFIFKKEKNLDLIIEKYWKEELRIEPIKYSGVLKKIKNRIYNI